MFGFGKEKDKDLDRWVNEHIDMKEDAYVMVDGRAIDKYGNEVKPNEKENKIVTLARQKETETKLMATLESIEKTLKLLAVNLARQEGMTFKPTKEQNEYINKMLKTGVFESRAEAIRNMVENEE